MKTVSRSLHLALVACMLLLAVQPGIAHLLDRLLREHGTHLARSSSSMKVTVNRSLSKHLTRTEHNKQELELRAQACHQHHRQHVKLLLQIDQQNRMTVLSRQQADSERKGSPEPSYGDQLYVNGQQGPTHIQTVESTNNAEDIIIRPDTPWNVALGRPTTVDSFNEPYRGPRAVDGYRATNNDRWVSLAGNPEHWVEVDIGLKLIHQIKFWTGYYMGGSTTAEQQPSLNNKWWHPLNSYKFQRQNLGIWEDIIFVEHNVEMAANHHFQDIEASVVRFWTNDGPSPDGAMRLFELEVWGICMPSDTEDH